MNLAKDSALAFCQSRGDTIPYRRKDNVIKNRFARDFRQPPTDFNSNKVPTHLMKSNTLVFLYLISPSL